MFLAELVVGGVVDVMAFVVVTIVVISVDNGSGSIFGGSIVVKKTSSVSVTVSGDVVVSCIVEVVEVVVVVVVGVSSK